MAKKALINREVKRIALSKKYAAKRAAIFAIINFYYYKGILFTSVVRSILFFNLRQHATCRL